jgi:hypothetical protein
LYISKCHENRLRKQWIEDTGKAIIAFSEKKQWTLKSSNIFEVPRTSVKIVTNENTLRPKQEPAIKLGRKTFLGTSLEEQQFGSTLTTESSWRRMNSLSRHVFR